MKPALSLTGNPDRGGQHFNKLCASCHALHGSGHALGPDLTALTDRSTPYLLTAIVDPNAAVEGKFVAYNVETSDDRSLTGLVAEESSAGLVIAMPNGIRETVARSALTSMSSTKLSLMPEGLEEGLSPQELADLIAYIQRAGGK
jgi:putative heme-binding domain-containing protein